MASAAATEMAWLSGNGEIGPLLADDSLSDAQFMARIQQTNWWKQTNPAMRAWDALQATDPQSAEDRINESIRYVTPIAIAMGHDPYGNPSWVRHVAYQRLRFGWDDSMLKNVLRAESKGYQGEQSLTGDIGKSVRDLKTLASTWGVPTSDAGLYNFAQSMQVGELTWDAAQTMFQGIAKSLFPAIADDIDRGVTVSQYMSPYMEIAAQELGINPAEMTLFDPKWTRVLNNVDSSGKRTPMDLNTWTKTIRTDSQYGWDTTPKAQEQAAQFASRALERFGIL